MCVCVCVCVCVYVCVAGTTFAAYFQRLRSATTVFSIALGAFLFHYIYFIYYCLYFYYLIYFDRPGCVLPTFSLLWIKIVRKTLFLLLFIKIDIVFLKNGVSLLIINIDTATCLSIQNINNINEIPTFLPTFLLLEFFVLCLC